MTTATSNVDHDLGNVSLPDQLHHGLVPDEELQVPPWSRQLKLSSMLLTINSSTHSAWLLGFRPRSLFLWTLE